MKTNSIYAGCRSVIEVKNRFPASYFCVYYTNNKFRFAHLHSASVASAWMNIHQVIENHLKSEFSILQMNCLN